MIIDSGSKSDLHSLHLNDLRNRCTEESDHFFHRRANDPRFCFEIFRRAIAKRDEAAWECIYQQYQALVAGWIGRHSYFQALDEEKDYYINRAFEKMWQGLTPEKFAKFPDLKSILVYLQTCVHSVLADAMRSRDRAMLFDDQDQAEETLADSTRLSMEERIEQRQTAETLWKLLQEKCKDEKERCTVYASFVLGLKPAEIVQEYPKLFDDSQEVYRVKENLLARLKRDPELDEFLRGL